MRERAREREGRIQQTLCQVLAWLKHWHGLCNYGQKFTDFDKFYSEFQEFVRKISKYPRMGLDSQISWDSSTNILNIAFRKVKRN